MQAREGRMLVPALRALQDLSPARLLALLPPSVTVSGGLAGVCDSLLTHHHMLDLHLAHLQAGMDSAWGPEPSPAGPVDTAVLFMPRSKARASYLMAAFAALCSEEGHLVLVGGKRSGAASMRSRIEEGFGPVVEEVRARGCVALTASGGRVSATPPGEERFPVPGPGGEDLAAVSLPGVFSHGRLDPGTELLLEHLEPGSFRRALDWGCGCGVIGAFLAAARPEARVDLADIDAMAAEASRRTLSANGLHNARVRGSVGFSRLQGPWDLIAANPPFHRGAGRDRGPAETLLREAPSRLGKGGRLVLVANAFLPYERLLRSGFGSVRSLCEGEGYKVLEAVRA